MIYEMIYEMISTPTKRLELEGLSDENKLDLVMKLTESSNFIELLEYIKQSFDDAEWCNSYR